MKLFHSFPRPPEKSTEDSAATSLSHEERDELGFLILKSILKYGLVCTPERLKLYPDEQTSNPAKLDLLREGKPDYLHVQSRFCTTLCDADELFKPKIRGLVPGPYGPVRAGKKPTSHAALFGPWSIAFETSAARHIGFVPTFYFSPDDLMGRRFHGLGAPGLGLQIIHRLRELRELMIILAHIERSVRVGDHVLVDAATLKSLDLDLPLEPEIMENISRLSLKKRADLVKHFNTDRESAVNLVGFIDMMLSLFQETDSTIDGEQLAFYQQREWRLIHHWRLGVRWYSLGHQPPIRNPLAKERSTEIAHIRGVLERCSGRERSESYFASCWVLETIDEMRPLDFIGSIIVPNEQLPRVRCLLGEEGVPADLHAAEDFGFSET
jgi:hypothetical protein